MLRTNANFIRICSVSKYLLITKSKWAFNGFSWFTAGKNMGIQESVSRNPKFTITTGPKVDHFCPNIMMMVDGPLSPEVLSTFLLDTRKRWWTSPWVNANYLNVEVIGHWGLRTGSIKWKLILFKELYHLVCIRTITVISRFKHLNSGHHIIATWVMPIYSHSIEHRVLKLITSANIQDGSRCATFSTTFTTPFMVFSATYCL